MSSYVVCGAYYKLVQIKYFRQIRITDIWPLLDVLTQGHAVNCIFTHTLNQYFNTDE